MLYRLLSVFLVLSLCCVGSQALASTRVTTVDARNRYIEISLLDVGKSAESKRVDFLSCVTSTGGDEVNCEQLVPGNGFSVEQLTELRRGENLRVGLALAVDSIVLTGVFLSGVWVSSRAAGQIFEGAAHFKRDLALVLSGGGGSLLASYGALSLLSQSLTLNPANRLKMRQLLEAELAERSNGNQLVFTNVSYEDLEDSLRDILSRAPYEEIRRFEETQRPEVNDEFESSYDEFGLDKN